jgi:hypothetical protein
MDKKDSNYITRDQRSEESNAKCQKCVFAAQFIMQNRLIGLVVQQELHNYHLHIDGTYYQDEADEDLVYFESSNVSINN